MKIGILTLWDSDNYGAYLQAYSLGKYLEKKGNEVYFYKITKKSKRPFSYVTRNFTYTPYLYVLFHKYKKYKAKFKLCDVTDKMDIAIIGSDEVWNTKNVSFIHYPQYIGEKLSAKKTITYAVSCNGTTRDEFEKTYPKSDLKKLDAISVRDKSTINLVNSFDMKATLVLDPTLLMNDFKHLETEIKEINQTKYMLVYGYKFTEEEIDKIKKLSQKMDLKIVTCGPYHQWSDIRIPASPGEFLSLVRNAEAMITSTFHGTVFSLIYNKKFLSLCRENQKMLELLDTVGLMDRNVTINDNFYEKMESKIPYNRVNNIIDILRANSESYLKDAMEEVNES